MDTKFTKGKWKTSSSMVYVDNGPIVAECDHGTIEALDEEIANANLIAAAPDMYELLDNIRILCEWGHDKQTLIDLILTEILPEIKETLKKVRSE